MSLILDALNRADQERTEENHTPNLHASHGPAPETANPVRRWIIEGAIVSLAVGVFAYSLWSGDKAPEASAQIEFVAVPAIPTPAEGVPPAPQQTVAATPIKKTETEKAIVKTVVEKSAAPETSAAITSLYKQPAAEKKASAPVISKAPIVKEQDIDNTRFILQQIPLITERSSRFQRSIPNIDYAVHVFSKKDGAGFVKLNGNIMRIGAQVVPGLRLIAILNDSIVLDLKGVQFRLPALNSWVNYN